MREGIIFLLLVVCTVSLFIPPSAEEISYEGRFFHDKQESKAFFDWSCTTFRFSVVELRAASADLVKVALEGGNHRFQLKVQIQDNITSTIFTTSNKATNYTVKLPLEGTYQITLKKLTESTFDARIPSHFGSISLHTAVFHGIYLEGENKLAMTSDVRSRKIEFYGASDTAGFGADGYPNPGTFSCFSKMNEYENCAESFSGQLAEKFNAQIHLQAMAGRGLVRNADEWVPFLSSGPTIPEAANRTICADSDPGKVWNFSSWVPDLVILSLGGNDYNNIKKPVESIFVQAYIRFLEYIYQSYKPNLPTIINICGGSSPSDHSRNRACPFVSNASSTYNTKYPSFPVHYVELPLDIVPDDDIACMGHHNADGHKHIVDYLTPKIESIMQWTSSP